MRMVVVGLLVMLVPLTLMVTAVVGRSRVPEGAAEAFGAAHGLAPTDPVRLAVGHFLARTRDFGRLGLEGGLLAGAMIGLGWHARITVGFGPSPVGDLATMGLAGWFVGLVLSARYRHRLPAAGARSVALFPRRPDRYRPRWLALLALALGSFSAVVGGAALLAPGWEHRTTLVLLAVLSAAVLASTERSQHHIARRPQSFASLDLLAVDEALRRVTSQAIGFAAAGLLVLIDGWQLSFLARSARPGPEGAAGTVLVVSALVAGLVLAGRARRTLRPKVGERLAATA